jgi:hypothetical protein
VFFGDRFVVVENLRYMLKDVPPTTPVWYGCNFRKFNPQGYMSGGAGEKNQQLTAESNVACSKSIRF